MFLKIKQCVLKYPTQRH